MKKEECVIKFNDGNYLMKGSPRNYEIGNAVSSQSIEDARLFKSYEAAENISAKLISPPFNRVCEVELKTKEQ